MFITQGRFWMQLRMKVPPRTDGEYSPHHCQSAQRRMLTQPTGAEKNTSCKLPRDRVLSGLRAEGHMAGGISKSARKSTIFPRKERKGKQACDGWAWAYLDSLAELVPQTLNSHKGADSQAHTHEPG